VSFIGATDYCYRKEGQASITGSFKPGLLDRYEGFLALLASKAAKEPDSEECLMRVRRTAVDYVRLYAGIIEQSNLSGTAIKAELARMGASNLFTRYARKYPHEYLPRQQRIFQDALEKEWYGMAISLVHLRLQLKQWRGRRGKRTQ
jgi:glycosyltransferase EpsJ